MEIKDILEREMARTELTQYRLEKLSGVPQPTIQRILSGKTTDPKSLTIKKLCHAMQISTAVLLDNESVIRESGTEYLSGSPQAISLAKRYVELNEKDKRKLEDYIGLLESSATDR